MATQEPNVYAGLSVVVGGLMHARPRFFAKVMGELLFWVGEDKMMFGSRLRDLGAEVADRGARRLGLSRRHVLGLPALDDGREEEGARPQRRAPVRRRRCPRSCSSPTGKGRPPPRTTRSSWRARRDHAGAGARRARHRPRPRARRAHHLPGVRRLVRGVRRWRRRRAPAPADAAVRAELRVPHGIRRARGRAPGAGGARGRRRARRPLHRRRDQRRASGRRRLRRARFPGESAGDLDALRELFQRKALLARQGRVLR